MITERGVLAYKRGDVTIQLASDKGDLYSLEDLETFAHTPEFDMFFRRTGDYDNAVAIWDHRRMARKSGCACHGKYVEVRTLDDDTLRKWVEDGIGFKEKGPPLAIYNGISEPEGIPRVYDTEMPCNNAESSSQSRISHLYRDLEGCEFWQNARDCLQLPQSSVIVLTHEDGDIAYQVLHPAVAQRTGELLHKIDEKGHNQMVFFDQTTIEVPYRSCSDKCAPNVLSDILAHQMRSNMLLGIISNLKVHSCEEEEPETPEESTSENA
jgi:hypothetical protein